MPLEWLARGYKYERTPSIRRLRPPLEAGVPLARTRWYYDGAARSGRAEAYEGEPMSQEPRTEERREGTLPCPRCRGEMHPMFLYEDRDPDVWLCFSCGYLEWTSPGLGRAIPSVDQ